MTTMLMRMQHTSLQFSDTAAQQEHDVKTLYEEGEAFPVKTGTEAGPVDIGKGAGGKNNRELLQRYADEYNHVINFGGDSWVAVDRKIIVPKSVEKNDVFLVDNDEFIGTHGADRIMPTLSFEHMREGVGRVHVGAVHYPTKGATPGSQNYRVNQKCAEGISRWLQEVAAGPDLGFVNGDFNMNDKLLDFALGRNFTSLADELKAWENTGHGPIDGFCSYDRDGRVKAYHFKVLNDRELRLASDHYMCRGMWEIRLLKEDPNEQG